MKKKKQILFLSTVFIAGIIYVYMMNKRSHDKYMNAPKIRTELALKQIDVEKISFERSGLYLNKVQFNANGISSHSRVHYKDSVVLLRQIKPPFILRKKSSNDTLELIKNNKKYYLLVSQEISYSKGE